MSCFNLRLSKLFTATGLICFWFFTPVAWAQRSNGPDTSGVIIEVANQAQILTEDLYRIEGQCLFNLANEMYSRGPIKPGFQLRPESMQMSHDTNYNMHFSQSKSYRYFAPSAESNRGRENPCEASVQAGLGFSGPDVLSSKTDRNQITVQYLLNATCVDQADANGFTISFEGVPFFRYGSKRQLVKNAFGVLVTTDKYYASQISIDRGEIKDSSLVPPQDEIRARSKDEVFFRYPKNEYIACLQNGINQFGLNVVK